MVKKDAWPEPDPKEVKRAKKYFLEDLKKEEQAKEGGGTYTRDQMSEDWHRRRAENLAEDLRRPQHMLIEEAELSRLTSTGEVSLPVCLYGRELQPGETVILDDDNMTPHEAEFVEVVETINKKDGVFLVRVRLPKPPQDAEN
jgi:hypothetical protein